MLGAAPAPGTAPRPSGPGARDTGASGAGEPGGELPGSALTDHQRPYLADIALVATSSSLELGAPPSTQVVGGDSEVPRAGREPSSTVPPPPRLRVVVKADHSPKALADLWEYQPGADAWARLHGPATEMALSEIRAARRALQQGDGRMPAISECLQ